MKWFNLNAVILGIMTVASQAQGQRYQSVQLDSAGKLTITLSSGVILSPHRLHDQVSFSQPLISSNHRTVAWLANDVDPSSSQGQSDPLPWRLVLYRAGHVLRIFKTDQTFWSWHFVDQDEDVAFCTGPTHSGASICELHRSNSGRLRAKWDARAAGAPPLWVKGLAY